MHKFLMVLSIAVMVISTYAGEFDTIEIPLVIKKESAPDFLKREWSRVKSDAKDPWFYLSHTFPIFGPLGHRVVKKVAGGYGSDEVQQDKPEEMQIGTMMFDNLTLVGPPLKTLGEYRLWQASIPIVIKPSWNRIKKFKSDYTHVALEFTIIDHSGGGSSVQITDILPNTKFVTAEYGATVNLTFDVQANRKWGLVEAGGVGKTVFHYEWAPKINLISSGAAGNKAFVVFSKKKDDTGWIGRLPVEILLLAPESVKLQLLRVNPYLIYKDDQEIKIPLGNVETKLRFISGNSSSATNH